MTKYYYKEKRAYKKTLARKLGVLLFAVGMVISFYTFSPIISWQFYFSSFTNSINSPIPKTGVLTPSLIQSLVKSSTSDINFNSQDARTWFPKMNLKGNAPKINFYTLSIPKIHVTDALVSTTDYNIDKHLINYLGTSIPADNGNAVIIGHSTLPQLFDPKNYKTIFANAYLLREGDEIIANIDNIAYTYKIESIRVVDPEDTSAFVQTFDNSYLTIITCTPPGTIWKRLVIRSALQKI